jgi:hypothetical protein
LESPSGLPAADQPMIVSGAQVATAKTAKTATAPIRFTAKIVKLLPREVS